jgi:hypothetical protein
MVPGKSMKQVGPTNYISFTVNTTYNRGIALIVDLLSNQTISSATIDWGDGSVEKINILPLDTIQHTYSLSNRVYTIKLYSSELYKIKSISKGLTSPSTSNITSFNLRAVYNLEIWSMTESFITSLDISYLSNLKVLEFFSNTSLSTLSNFTNNPKILYVDMTNCGLTSTQVDDILVQINQINSIGDLTGTPYEGFEKNIYLAGTNGIPSARGRAAKTSLEGKGWTVSIRTV